MEKDEKGRIRKRRLAKARIRRVGQRAVQAALLATAQSEAEAAAAHAEAGSRSPKGKADA